MNIVVLDPATRAVERRKFDTHGGDRDAECDKMRTWLDEVGVAGDRFVLAAVRDSATGNDDAPLPDDCQAALKAAGWDGTRPPTHRGAWAFLGQLGTLVGGHAPHYTDDVSQHRPGQWTVEGENLLMITNLYTHWSTASKKEIRYNEIAPPAGIGVDGSTG